MNTYRINISYSWGDEEEPIEFEAENSFQALCRAIDMATKEAQVSMGCFKDADYAIYIRQIEQTVVLHYGNDDE